MRANKQFASLVNVPVDELRNGRRCIYEFLSVESLVSYFEKYLLVCKDDTQKAVLTSATLKNSVTALERPCCFSFTVKRDAYSIPFCIVGNFIATDFTQ